MSERTFEFEDGTSNKFWAISVSGDSHTVRFGKIGTNGQTKSKSFGTAEKATADADKLIAEKTGKGYKETTGGAAADRDDETDDAGDEGGSPPPKKPAPKSPAKKAKTPDPEEDDGDDEDEDEAPAKKPAPKKAAPKKKAQADDEGEDSDTAAAATTPVAAAGRTDIDLSPEDFLWVTSGERPKYDPPANDLTPDKLLDTLRNPGDWAFPKWTGNRQPYQLADSARLSAIPRMTDAEKIEARKLLRPMVAVANWPTGNYDFAPVPFMIAAALGMHPEMEAVVASWPDGYAGAKDSYAAFYKQPARVLFGLGSRTQVIEHGRRIGLRFDQTVFVRGWLAHTGTDALDLVRDSVLAAGKKDEAEKLLEEFCRVKVPAAAPFMLELMLDSKAPALARNWLTQNPASAADGLAKIAAGKGKLADAAKEFFAELKAKGQTATIRTAMAAHPESAAALQAILDHQKKSYPALDRAAMPTELRAALDALPKKAPAPPDWISAAALPPVLVGGAKLAEAEVAAMLSAFRSAKGDARPDVAVALKKLADARSLDTFAWAVFQTWSKAGFPSKDKWAILTLGWVGGDNSARQLTPLVREWPGQSQHQRAKVGLEVLRLIGTDIALTMLNGIAQKLKFAALKARARELMDLIATDRGMTRPELEDRIVPDLDLDEKGERLFDYGPRQFRLVIGPDLKPRAKGPDDKVKDSLPAPNAKDDAEKAELAKADWTAFTKTLKGVLELQRVRLEQAMVTMRRWAATDFETFLVRHPVMAHLTRRLVWGQYSSPTTVAATFRVTDEGEYADAGDKPVTLNAKLPVGLVHPMQLGDAVRNAWGQVFGDYEIVPPFQQLGRPVFALDEKEKGETTLDRVADIPVNSGKVWGFTEKRGWDRGSSSDHGVVTEFAKWYPAADVTAVFDIEPGIARGGLDMLSSEQAITGCYFLSGQYNPVAYARHPDKVKLGAVDAVAVSETLADLYRLTSKE